MSRRRLRLAAYAVVVREGRVLLGRPAESVTGGSQLWALPGGGVEHGEHPREAVVREVLEKTGLAVTVSGQPWVSSLHTPDVETPDGVADVHAVRLVFEGWVAKDASAPRTLEVAGSTLEAAWHPLAAVLDARAPVHDLVREGLEAVHVARTQRVAAYALLLREHPEPAVLLAQISERGFHAGSWTLPGGGIDHGESPRDAVRREVREEAGLEVEVGALLEVEDLHLRGTAPSGRDEDFHGIHLVFSATVSDPAATPRVAEIDGTTSAVAWVPVREVDGAARSVLEVVQVALAAARRVSSGG